MSDFVCIAGGPSLTKEDATLARQHCTVVGVNDAYRMIDVDYLYASDLEWWEHHADKVKDLDCRKIIGKQGRRPPEFVEEWPAEHSNNLRREAINFGRHSGFAALHLAILLGAERVLLLGYDMGGNTHWFGRHEGKLRNTSNYHQWVEVYETCNPPVPVINCSRRTALTAFPRMTIEEALCVPALSENQ